MLRRAPKPARRFFRPQPTYILAALLFLGAALSAPDPARAAEPEDDTLPDIVAFDDTDRNYSKGYIGAFTEYSVRSGLSIATEAPYKGWNLDLGFRHSFPMLLGDFRLGYRVDMLSPTDTSTPEAHDTDAILAKPGPMQTHSVGGYLAIHPGYLLLLGNDKLAYTLASLHAEIGFGMRYAILEPTDQQKELDVDYQSDLGPFVSLGVGLSIPILNPDEGYAPWLHLLYRWHVADFDGNIDTFDVNMHILQIGLGWRINGLLF